MIYIAPGGNRAICNGRAGPAWSDDEPVLPSGAVRHIADADRRGVDQGRSGLGDACAAPWPARAGPIAAVIFDLDGVLVDTEIWWDEVRRAFAHQHGRPWTADDRAAVMGANSRQWSRTMAQRLALDVPPPAIECAIVDGMVERWRTQPSPLIPGALDTVRRLSRHYPLAVASSAHPAVIEAALSTTGLRPAFRVVVSSDEVEHGKPAPDVYLAAALRLGVPAGDCLVVEDSLNGVLAGRAAGMTVALVPNLSIPPAAGAVEAADLVVPDLASLEPALLAGPGA